MIRVAFALVIAVAAGYGLTLLAAPLPWLIGPMLVFAFGNAFHAGLTTPRAWRACGQWLVGCALGLYFSLPVLERIASHAGWIALAVLASLLLSLLAARVLQVIGGADAATAFFASAVGGAAEMANQAERYGARIDQVAAAQAIRVLLVVLIVPFAFRASAVHGDDAYRAVMVPFALPGLLALLGIAAVAGAVLGRIGVPNAWLFGPLLISVGFTASGHALSSLPPGLVNAGQLLIGCSLGARFAPAFFRESPRYLLSVLLSACLLLVGCATIGAGVGWLSGIALPTALLATAPGGLAEMALTAKVLQLGVPVVTAFHAARLVAVVLSAGTAYRLLRHWRSRPR